MAGSTMRPEVLEALLGQHARFLGFLVSRVRNASEAEEILQDAFVRTLEKGGAIRDGERATAWFYRLLRNAIADRARRAGTEARSLSRAAEDMTDTQPFEADLEALVCECFKGLLPTLKPEYADILRRVDLEGEDPARVAASEGLTANNGAVRLHRARKALRARLVQSCGTCTTHGCLDCRCKKPGSPDRV